MSDIQFDRTPPQAVEAEQSVLGGMLLSRAAIADVAAELVAEDFYRPAHRLIYDAILALHQRGEPADAVTVAAELVASGGISKVGGHPYLHTLVSNVPTAANAGYYAAIVAERATARRLVEAGTRIAQMGYGLSNGAGLQGALDEAIARAVIEVDIVRQTRPGISVRGQLSTWDELWARPDALEDWLVPGLLEYQDVIMLLAEEGLGKSWVSRQWAMCLAAGVHPWNPARPVHPKRTLLIDGEVALSQLRRQSRYMGTFVSRVGIWQQGLAHVWSINDGMDLRDAKDVRMLESVVEDLRPDLLCIGPIYKMFKRRGDPWDTATEEVRESLDRIRRQYNCALFLEHHMAKGDGAGRPSTPYGSSEWMRWVSHGLILEQIGQANAYALEQFKRPRDPREFPPALLRSGGGEGTLPWMPLTDIDELKYIREQEDRNRKARR